MTTRYTRLPLGRGTIRGSIANCVLNCCLSLAGRTPCWKDWIGRKIKNRQQISQDNSAGRTVSAECRGAGEKSGEEFWCSVIGSDETELFGKPKKFGDGHRNDRNDEKRNFRRTSTIVPYRLKNDTLRYPNTVSRAIKRFSELSSTRLKYLNAWINHFVRTRICYTITNRLRAQYCYK